MGLRCVRVGDRRCTVLGTVRLHAAMRLSGAPPARGREARKGGGKVWWLQAKEWSGND